MGFTTTRSAYDISEQAAWEVRSVTLAVARYRDAAGGRNIDDLPPGRRAMLETIGPVSAVVTEFQQAAIGAQKGRPPGWHFPLLAFHADVLALIAVAVALRAAPMEFSRVGLALTSFSRRVCGALRDQADHDRFVRDQRAAKKIDPNGDLLLRRFQKAFPDANRRAWSRFAAKVEGARSGKWPDKDCVEIAAALSQALVRGAPDWFSVERFGLGAAARQPVCVLLTHEAVARLAEFDVRAEVARPLMLPMLIEPNPWQYKEVNHA
ncbi:MAG: hypothetical protein JWO24_2936 [Rhodospirillales bacterium]|jgi:hypothetical protein|nr:hypothetical protein [Rhodospirillales bacterium]